MRFAHRLVLVLGFLGGVFVWLAWGVTPPNGASWAPFIPLVMAAAVVYPTAWLFGGRR